MKAYIDITNTFETTILNINDHEMKVKCSLDGTVETEKDHNGHSYECVQYLEIQDIFVSFALGVEYYVDFEAMKNSERFMKKDLNRFKNECEERILENYSLMREERLSK